MRISSAISALALALPVLAAASPATTQAHKQKESLAQWFESTPWRFFPNQSSWEHGYNELFVKDGRYSFNDVNYDYDGLKANWQRVYGLVSTKLKSLVILAVDVVTVEDSDGLGGGIVFITGNETGTYLDGSTQNARDAAFGIVKVRSGKRKIVEWREATNYQESKGPS